MSKRGWVDGLARAFVFDLRPKRTLGAPALFARSELIFLAGQPAGTTLRSSREVNIRAPAANSRRRPDHVRELRLVRTFEL
jgi:hypothetical protein